MVLVPQERDSDSPGNSNDEKTEENGSEEAEREDLDEFHVILGAEEEGEDVQRRHIDKVFDRLSRKGKVEFDFGETGPMCMGTDSELSMMVQLALSECRAFSDEDDGEAEGNLDAMFRTRRNSAGCRDTERTAREMRMRNCMVEVLEVTDGAGRANMTAVGELMGGTRMGERFTADHLQHVAGCAKKAYYVVEKYKAEILEWMRSVEECRVGEDGELVSQRSAQGLPGAPISQVISALLDEDDDDDYEYAYEDYGNYFIPISENDVLQEEEVEEYDEDTEGLEQCAASCELQFGGDYVDYEYDEYEDYGQLLSRQNQRPKPNKSKRPNGKKKPNGASKSKGGKKRPNAANQSKGGKKRPNGANQSNGGNKRPNGANQGKGGNKRPNGANQGKGGKKRPNGASKSKGGKKRPNGANQSNGGNKRPNGANQGKGGNKRPNGANQGKGGKKKPNGANQSNGGNKKPNGANQSKGGNNKGKGVNNTGQGAKPNGNKGKGQKGNGQGVGPSKGKGKGNGKATGSVAPNKDDMEFMHDMEDNHVMDQELIDEIKEMSDEELLLAAKNVLTLGCIQKSYGESCKLYIMDTILSQYPTPKPPVQVNPIILDDINGGWLTAQPIDDPQTDDGPFPEFPPDSPKYRQAQRKPEETETKL